MSTIVGFVLVGTIYDIFSMSKDYLDTNANQLKLNSLFIGDFLISKKIETNEEKSKCIQNRTKKWLCILTEYLLLSVNKKTSLEDSINKLFVDK